MKNEILVICPSRGRPANVAALVESWQLMSVGYSQLLIALDEDDEANYPRLPGVLYEVNPRIRMVPTLNLVANKYAEQYNYLGFVGDDHRFRTPGWDFKVFDELINTRHGIVYGNDLLQGELLATEVFLDAQIVRKLGYMAPPNLIHMYADNFWMDIGRTLGSLVYRDDIIVEHMHPAAGKVETDAQYAEVDGFTNADREQYEIYKSVQFYEDIEKLS